MVNNSYEVLNELKSKGLKASTLSTYDFFTLYTTLPHHLIKDKLIGLIERTFSLWLVTTNVLPSRPMCTKIIIYGLVKTFVRPLFIFWIIFLLDLELNFTNKLRYSDRYCAPLVADVFLFSYERYFMKSLALEYQTDIIEAFNSTSRYLDDLLNIDNIYFEQMLNFN